LKNILLFPGTKDIITLTEILKWLFETFEYFIVLFNRFPS